MAGSDLAFLWLADVAQIQPLAQELLCTTGEGLPSKKNNKDIGLVFMQYAFVVALFWGRGELA